MATKFVKDLNNLTLNLLVIKDHITNAIVSMNGPLQSAWSAVCKKDWACGSLNFLLLHHIWGRIVRFNYSMIFLRLSKFSSSSTKSSTRFPEVLTSLFRVDPFRSNICRRNTLHVSLFIEISTKQKHFCFPPVQCCLDVLSLIVFCGKLANSYNSGF